MRPKCKVIQVKTTLTVFVTTKINTNNNNCGLLGDSSLRQDGCIAARNSRSVLQLKWRKTHVNPLSHSFFLSLSPSLPHKHTHTHVPTNSHTHTQTHKTQNQTQLHSHSREISGLSSSQWTERNRFLGVSTRVNLTRYVSHLPQVESLLLPCLSFLLLFIFSFFFFFAPLSLSLGVSLLLLFPVWNCDEITFPCTEAFTVLLVFRLFCYCFNVIEVVARNRCGQWSVTRLCLCVYMCVCRRPGWLWSHVGPRTMLSHVIGTVNFQSKYRDLFIYFDLSTTYLVNKNKKMLRSNF